MKTKITITGRQGSSSLYFREGESKSRLFNTLQSLGYTVTEIMTSVGDFFFDMFDADSGLVGDCIGGTATAENYRNIEL